MIAGIAAGAAVCVVLVVVLLVCVVRRRKAVDESKSGEVCGGGECVTSVCDVIVFQMTQMKSGATELAPFVASDSSVRAVWCAG
jgi:hypothetical protein